MKLVFIRHTSVDVPQGTCYGQTDVPLAVTFPVEAADVRRRLGGYVFDKVYCSPLTRCRQLAGFCGYQSPIIDDRLMEMDFGDWEMQLFDNITDPRLQEWYDDFLNVTPTGGESTMDQARRLQFFLDSLKVSCADDRTVAIFTHGGILIHASVMLGGKTYDEAFTALPPYGAILELRYPRETINMRD